MATTIDGSTLYFSDGTTQNTPMASAVYSSFISDTQTYYIGASFNINVNLYGFNGISAGYYFVMGSFSAYSVSNCRYVTCALSLDGVLAKETLNYMAAGLSATVSIFHHMYISANQVVYLMAKVPAATTISYLSLSLIRTGL